MARSNYARRISAVQANLDAATTAAMRALPTDELERLQEVFDVLTEPRRRLTQEQADLWRKFADDFRRRYADLLAQQTRR